MRSPSLFICSCTWGIHTVQCVIRMHSEYTRPLTHYDHMHMHNHCTTYQCSRFIAAGTCVEMDMIRERSSCCLLICMVGLGGIIVGASFMLTCLMFATGEEDAEASLMLLLPLPLPLPVATVTALCWPLLPPPAAAALLSGLAPCCSCCCMPLMVTVAPGSLGRWFCSACLCSCSLTGPRPSPACMVRSTSWVLGLEGRAVSEAARLR